MNWREDTLPHSLSHITAITIAIAMMITMITITIRLEA